MAQEPIKEKAGGLAYEMILKPASADSAPRPKSPPKERPLSQEFIEKKLKEAEERRQSMEQAKLALVAKDKARQAEALKKVEDLNDSFSKESLEKHTQKLESMAEKKNTQIQALQDRLRDHAQRVQMVRTTCDNYTEEQRKEILKKMEKRLSTMEENRKSQLKQIQERLSEHEKHVAEVLDSSAKFSKVTEEKIIQKMETTLKNREGQLEMLRQRLAEHEQHIQEVRGNKLNRSQLEAGDAQVTSS